MTIRRFLSILVLVCTVFMYTVSANAVDLTETTIGPKVYVNDSEYYIVTIEEDVTLTTFATTKTKSASKTYSFYSGDNLQWQFTLTGNFEYNGTTSTCKGVSKSTPNIADGWRLDTYAIWADANMAKAEATFKKKVLFVDISTQEINLTVTCDKNGNIS